MIRNALATLGGPSRLRFAAQRSYAGPNVVRTFQTTRPALKKRRTVEVEEDVDSAEAEDEALFDDDAGVTAPGTIVDRKTQRENIKSSILAAVAVKGKERRVAGASLPIGSLRKVAQLSESAEDVEELRGVLRTWRVLGKKVTTQTAVEIIGRCCNLGRPDLAKELSQDRVQYGFPEVPSAAQFTIDAALANFSPAPVSASGEAALPA
ncbi:uncharacterized protein MKK02DRAFT_44934 [Dioszegia hungarica]|uniref:Uncharacterized protein n=1 Tax=Dioszegia hungarica TaxID=4972 RepID=A0AA38H9R7_9TREE|nr:uncharacterized protein MKK02DRAFT_44934 [Dioszegia hungarica]KAI9636230.1 hypothetical protein MKK02DRAFT_44934 [Dioszegia hungarica]